MEYAKGSWQKELKSVWNGRLSVRRRRQNVRLRKNVKQKNVPRPSVRLIECDEETEKPDDAAEALSQEAEILHLNLKSVIMPPRTTMIICLQRIMRI